MVKLTRKQREAVFRVFQRDWPSHVTPFKRTAGRACPHCGKPVDSALVKVSSVMYRRFRALVRPFGFNDPCVMLPWKGMWLGIEEDGHTHS